MGSVGDAYDNAMCESLFATLECELLDRSRFPTPADARREVFGFIEGFYNTRRIHSALGYESPANFERLNHAAEATVQRRGNRSAPDFSWLFASSVMYVASLTGMTREKRNHIRHHQPQKPTVRESGVAPRRLRFLDWLQVYAGRLWSTQQGQGRREKRFGAWRGFLWGGSHEWCRVMVTIHTEESTARKALPIRRELGELPFVHTSSFCIQKETRRGLPCEK